MIIIVLFYGVRVSATAEYLHALVRDNRSARLVDPLWGGALEEEMSNEYEVSKVVMLLLENNVNFIQSFEGANNEKHFSNIRSRYLIHATLTLSNLGVRLKRRTCCIFE